MNGSKEPFAPMNVFHRASNFVIRTTNVRSTLSFFSEPGGRRLARDAMGGGFKTFSPQPVNVSVRIPQQKDVDHEPITTSTSFPEKVV